MTTYRTGNHWGVTIVREPDPAEVCADSGCPDLDHHTGPQLVAVVVNGDQALAERICALLNGDEGDAGDHEWSVAAYRVYSHWVKAGDKSAKAVYAAIQAAYAAGLASGAPSTRVSSPVSAEEGSGIVGSGSDGSKPAETISVRPRPPVPRRSAPPPTVDKPKNGTASRPPGWACPRHGAVI